MKYALISEEQIKQVQDALEPVKASFAAQAVLEIIRSLKPSKPVAWQNLHLPDEFYDAELLDPSWYSHYRPLYALDEVTK